MRLYNCCSPEELQLKNTNLEDLSISELKKLAQRIRKNYFDVEGLEDSIIVVDALTQIVEELASRIEGR